MKDNNKSSSCDKFTCACGGKYTRYNKKAHEKSAKHQSYLGVDVKIVTGGRPKKPDGIIGSLMGKRTADCTEEELEKRRSYIRIKNREYRQRVREKKAAEQALNTSTPNQSDFAQAVEAWTSTLNEWGGVAVTSLEVATVFVEDYPDRPRDVSFKDRDGRWSLWMDTVDREWLVGMVRKQRDVIVPEPVEIG